MEKSLKILCVAAIILSVVPYVAAAGLPKPPLEREMGDVMKKLRSFGYNVNPRKNIPTIIRCDDCLQKYKAAALYFTIPDTIFVPSYFKEEGDLESKMLFRHEVCHAFLEKESIPHEEQEKVCRRVEKSFDERSPFF